MVASKSVDISPPFKGDSVTEAVKKRLINIDSKMFYAAEPSILFTSKLAMREKTTQ